MITTIVVLAYVASVFMARWINKVSIRYNKYAPVLWITWIVPFLNIFINSLWCVMSFFWDRKPNYPKWFNEFKGDNW